MKLLLLTVCLICALIHRAESLQCHVCGNKDCSNSTSVTCPILSTVCITVTIVRASGSSPTVSVNKDCSSLLTCVTPLNTQTEWSVNQGFQKLGFNQLCCTSDDCNFPTLATPSLLPNGKECPACSSANASLAETCNSTLPCVGVEDTCFNGTGRSPCATVSSTEEQRFGCISKNLCSLQLALDILLGPDAKITCGAPWGVRLSAVLLMLALTMQRVLV